MIGRLVEKQNIGLGRKDPARAARRAFAAGEARGIFLAAEAKLVQEGFRAVGVITWSEPRLDIGECGCKAGKIRLLRQIAHMSVGLHEARPAIGFEQARRDLQKRRFARPIATDKAQALARRDGKIGGLKQRLAAEG